MQDLNLRQHTANGAIYEKWDWKHSKRRRYEVNNYTGDVVEVDMFGNPIVEEKTFTEKVEEIDFGLFCFILLGVAAIAAIIICGMYLI